jgi:hypothetical protein
VVEDVFIPKYPADGPVGDQHRQKDADGQPAHRERYGERRGVVAEGVDVRHDRGYMRVYMAPVHHVLVHRIGSLHNLRPDGQPDHAEDNPKNRHEQKAAVNPNTSRHIATPFLNLLLLLSYSFCLHIAIIICEI